MKVLFLDIDGVLNSLNFFEKRALGENRFDDPERTIMDRFTEDIDPEALQLLKDFVTEYDINIVISSSWRVGAKVSELREIFEYCGWKEPPIIDKTPTDNLYDTIRGKEIEAWLSKLHRQPIEKYAIIDDDADMTDEQKKNHFVHTEWEWGLRPKHIEQLKIILEV